jgi:hypothetical protein
MTVKKVKEFACISWTIDDVHIFRRDNEMTRWTDDDAEYWLTQNEDNLVERMTEKGWDVFEFCMEEEVEVNHVS